MPAASGAVQLPFIREEGDDPLLHKAHYVTCRHAASGAGPRSSLRVRLSIRCRPVRRPLTLVLWCRVQLAFKKTFIAGFPVLNRHNATTQAGHGFRRFFNRNIGGRCYAFFEAIRVEEQNDLDPGPNSLGNSAPSPQRRVRSRLRAPPRLQ